MTKRRNRTSSALRVAAMFALMGAAAGVDAAGTGGNAAPQGLAGPAEGETLAQWTERWLDGPVSLIATGEERALYGELSTAQERLQFIRLFWERRDPRLRGPRNEYLDEFERRLTYVEDNFTTSRHAGWETIFGEVVLLLGVPDRTRRQAGLPAGFSDRPAILWSYDERLPGMEPNEDLLFVFRAGRWKLMPPSPIGGGSIPEAARQLEAQTLLGGIPSDYQVAIDESVAASLVNPVDYRGAIADVRTTVRLPDAQIPFSWSTRVTAGEGGQARLEIDISWLMNSLVFHLVDGNFTTDMVVDVEAHRGDEVVGATSERVLIAVPEAEMEGRREEVVRRTISLEVEPGSYVLEITLLDQLLGYRTFYREEIEVRSS